MRQISDPKDFGRVAVLMGGTSSEREVSLNSGANVLDALRAQGVQAEAVDGIPALVAALGEGRFDRVFNILHGGDGENGVLQGLLDAIKVPYTGSGVLGSALTLDKIRTKQVWLSSGLPTPRFVRLAQGDQSRERVMTMPDELGLPLIVKPPREGSSIGVTKVQGYSQMQDAVRLAARYDPDVLCEEFIDGIEVTCPVLGEGASARALPVVRIAAPEGKYDYQNKYFTDEVHYHVPSGLPGAEEAEIQRIVLAAYRALECRGWGRADLMVRAADRQPFLLEMNTSPGMTGHSLVPMSAKAAGISYEQLCLLLLASARLDAPAVHAGTGG